ncbi:hypothetical protein CVT24_006509 [Panaeolus cyanescens]|uniref:Uncharacterized protein n=1 Tax=Panaeolus cyanescens TaxID=181874 RepID=A0A409VZS5_9AGAR|nr:hypothetical protein CVT24_006509 [Panaeolus cyanescens]
MLDPAVQVSSLPIPIYSRPSMLDISKITTSLLGFADDVVHFFNQRLSLPRSYQSSSELHAQCVRLCEEVNRLKQYAPSIFQAMDLQDTPISQDIMDHLQILSGEIESLMETIKGKGEAQPPAVLKELASVSGDRLKAQCERIASLSNTTVNELLDSLDGMARTKGLIYTVVDGKLRVQESANSASNQGNILLQYLAHESGHVHATIGFSPVHERAPAQPIPIRNTGSAAYGHESFVRRYNDCEFIVNNYDSNPQPQSTDRPILQAEPAVFKISLDGHSPGMDHFDRNKNPQHGPAPFPEASSEYKRIFISSAIIDKTPVLPSNSTTKGGFTGGVQVSPERSLARKNIPLIRRESHQAPDEESVAVALHSEVDPGAGLISVGQDTSLPAHSTETSTQVKDAADPDQVDIGDSEGLTVPHVNVGNTHWVRVDPALSPLIPFAGQTPDGGSIMSGGSFASDSTRPEDLLSFEALQGGACIIIQKRIEYEREERIRSRSNVSTTYWDRDPEEYLELHHSTIPPSHGLAMRNSCNLIDAVPVHRLHLPSLARVLGTIDEHLRDDSERYPTAHAVDTETTTTISSSLPSSVGGSSEAMSQGNIFLELENQSLDTLYYGYLQVLEEQRVASTTSAPARSHLKDAAL